MIETLVQTTDIGANAVMVIGLVLIFQRLGRLEKDVATLAEKSDDYHAKVDHIEGRLTATERRKL